MYLYEYFIKLCSMFIYLLHILMHLGFVIKMDVKSKRGLQASLNELTRAICQINLYYLVSGKTTQI